jgi:hypothetical protein
MIYLSRFTISIVVGWHSLKPHPLQSPAEAWIGAVSRDASQEQQLHGMPDDDTDCEHASFANMCDALVIWCCE